MADYAHQLRNLIERRLVGEPHVSLVSVLAEFDHKNQCIPSPWRWNAAIASVSQSVSLSSDGLCLIPTQDGVFVELSDVDVLRIVDEYRKAASSR